MELLESELGLLAGLTGLSLFGLVSRTGAGDPPRRASRQGAALALADDRGALGVRDLDMLCSLHDAAFGAPHSLHELFLPNWYSFAHAGVCVHVQSPCL